MIIQLRYKILGMLLAVLAILLGLRYCGRPKAVPGHLAPGERQHITVKGHSVTVTTAQGATKQYAPDKVDISVSDIGTVKIHVQEFGFGLEPGAGMLIAGKYAKPFVDTRLVYYYRASLNVGLDINLDSKAKFMGDSDSLLHPIVFGHYSLPIAWLDGQLGAFIGYELAPTTLTGGLRWRF